MKTPYLTPIAVFFSLLSVSTANAIDVDSSINNIVNGDSFNNFNITHTVDSMSGGNITFMSNNARINNLSGGTISIMDGNAQVDNMSGGFIAGMFGNTQIDNMSGGNIGNVSGSNNSIIFTGDATSQTGGALVGHVNNSTNLTLTDNGFMTIAAGASTFDGHLNMQGGTVRLMSGVLGTNHIFNMLSGANNTLWAVADTSGVNLNIASGLTGHINTNLGVTLELNNLIADNTTILNKDGTGTLTFATANNYNGATSVNGGSIKATADNIFSANSDFTTQIAGALDLNGYDQTLKSLNHAGVVNFGGTGGNTLTITGNYIGNNGLLNMNSVLGNDASVTDKLNVLGSTSGTTYIQVNNLGGSGAQTLNGIELINVAGTSDGDFIQVGRAISGAYDYYLNRGLDANANNWYLNSTPGSVNPGPGGGGSGITDPDPESGTGPEQRVERPEAGAYGANLAAANTMFATSLHDRLGETQYIDALTGEHKVTSMWMRNEGGHNRSRDTNGQLDTRADRYVLQIGGDIAQWSNNGLDRFHLGVMAGYGTNSSTTDSRISGYSAKGSIDGYSTGIYGTWYANDADKTGLYVDSWAQYSWFDNTVDGQDLAVEEYKSKGITASVESGYTFKVGENAAKNASYFIQPKAQVTWMGVKADDHKEANGTRVSGEGDGNIQTHLGVKAFMNRYSDKNKEHAIQPFVEANWIHNTKDFGVALDNAMVKQDGAANIAELKLGVEGQLNKKVNLWGNVGQQIGNKGYSDTAVMFGVKYNF
ncbi:autotransporter protein [Yersinia frederiksenii]|nr:autotransporter protein [Yersinia frederiksenii]CNI64462.1 autotransporter protein [Yersinia frederiksenii]